MSRHRTKEIPTLNITSLLDMFTIMLLFLLVNFSDVQEKVKLYPGLALPRSNAELDAVNAIDVILTKDKLILEDRVVMKLRHGKFSKSQLNGDQIKPYYRALVKLKKKYRRLEDTAKARRIRRRKKGRKLASSEKERRDVILFQTDRAMAFNLIDKVMMTTAQAGFKNFKFAVLKDE